jgi:hypothetical protein
MFWFSDNGFQKKGKVGRVFIFCSLYTFVALTTKSPYSVWAKWTEGFLKSNKKICILCLKYGERGSDHYLTQSKQFFSHIVARTSQLYFYEMIIGNCSFSAQHAAWKSMNKDWLSRNQENLSWVEKHVKDKGITQAKAFNLIFRY